MIMGVRLDGLPNVDFHTFTETANDITVTRRLIGNATKSTSRGDLLNLREQQISGQSTEGSIYYGYYQGHSIGVGYDNGKGGQYNTVELTTVDLNVDTKKGYYSTFTASANLATLPLERKTVATGTTDDTYKTWWNHNVAGKDTLADLSEDNKTTIKAVTDGIMPSALATTGYYFAKTNQALKTGEKIFLPADKPGVQGYLFPTNEVQENVYARTKATMLSFLDMQGFLMAPRNHADEYVDGSKTAQAGNRWQADEKWLVVSVTYRKVFGWYEGTIKYKYGNQGWDADLYSEVTE